MPLMHGKSEKAFKHNLETEMEHGKSKKQSLAIAYAMKRKKAHGGDVDHSEEECHMAHGGKCYAGGGSVEEGMKKAFKTPSNEPEVKAKPEPTPKHDPILPAADSEHPLIKGLKNAFKAEGGEVGKADKMIDDIMKLRMSKGGQVANDSHSSYAGSLPAEFDDLVLRDDLEFSYTGENSGDEIGNHQEDKDRHDIISMIMKSRKKKDKMPHPA